MFLPAHQSNFCQRYSSSFARSPGYRPGMLITCVTIKLIDWIVFHAISEIFQLYNGGKKPNSIQQETSETQFSFSDK